MVNICHKEWVRIFNLLMCLGHWSYGRLVWSLWDWRIQVQMHESTICFLLQKIFIDWLKKPSGAQFLDGFYSVASFWYMHGRLAVSVIGCTWTSSNLGFNRRLRYKTWWDMTITSDGKPMCSDYKHEWHWMRQLPHQTDKWWISLERCTTCTKVNLSLLSISIARGASLYCNNVPSAFTIAGCILANIQRTRILQPEGAGWFRRSSGRFRWSNI